LITARRIRHYFAFRSGSEIIGKAWAIVTNGSHQGLSRANDRARELGGHGRLGPRGVDVSRKRPAANRVLPAVHHLAARDIKGLRGLEQRLGVSHIRTSAKLHIKRPHALGSLGPLGYILIAVLPTQSFKRLIGVLETAQSLLAKPNMVERLGFPFGLLQVIDGAGPLEQRRRVIPVGKFDIGQPGAASRRQRRLGVQAKGRLVIRRRILQIGRANAVVGLGTLFLGSPAQVISLRRRGDMQGLIGVGDGHVITISTQRHFAVIHLLFDPLLIVAASRRDKQRQSRKTPTVSHQASKRYSHGKVSGLGKQSFTSLMLIEPLLAHAASQPDEIAVIDEAGKHTYRQLAGFAAALGQHIASRTTRPTVGILLPAGVGFVASFYGSLWAGKSVTPINFLLSQREIAHIIADSGIDTVITIPLLGVKLKDTPLQVIDLTALKAAAATLPTTFTPPPLPLKSPDDMAVLMYTSGTSGLPKGVILTFANLQSDVDAAIQHANLQHRHRFLGVIPLFHSFGMTAMMLAPIQLGSTIIYMARFNAQAAVKAIREYAVSLAFAVPSMFGAMLHLKGAMPHDFGSIYAMISGGEPLPAALAQSFQERFGQRIYEGYGLTETSPVVALNVPQSYRDGSVGKLVPGARVRITGEDGQDMPVGESGEVWISGPMVMKGYHNLPTETADVLTPDRFFKTGDIGRFDADGFLSIVGRKKELIIVAGEKAVPREIEEALLRHPALAEAAVVGKKDAGRGEIVVAFVTPKEGKTVTADELRQTCRDAGLPQWKIPREVFIEADLPRSPTGKVLKRLLVERLSAAGS
jgi:long-chain acyl-CoA synthetase